MTAAETRELQKLRDQNRLLREALLKAPSRQRLNDQGYWTWHRGPRARALDDTRPLVEDVAHA